MSKRKRKSKDIEMRLISELMKNSHRSDRELARVLKTSQPTVTRTRTKLEKEGIIKEYTMIPDFAKLGYDIMSFTRFQLRSEGFNEPARALARKRMEDNHASLIAHIGISEKRNRVHVAFYRTYSEYSTVMRSLNTLPGITVDNVDTFLVDLKNQSNYGFFSMSSIANNLLQHLGKKESQESTRT